MEIVNNLSKQDEACRFCSAGQCPNNPVTIKTVIKGKTAKLNICLPSKVPTELKGEKAKIYSDDELRELKYG